MLGEHLTNSFLHRIQGETLLKREVTNFAAGGTSVRTAVAIARQQGARSFALRAALSLAKLSQSTGRSVDDSIAMDGLARKTASGGEPYFALALVAAGTCTTARPQAARPGIAALERSDKKKPRAADGPTRGQ
jgi:hypothetical protein